MLQIEMGQLVTQIISFLVMYWILKKYAWVPLLGILAERQRKINADVEAIEKQQKQVDLLVKEYDRKIKEIDAYSWTKTQEAVEQGKKLAGEIQKDAQVHAKELLTQVQEDLQKEVAKAKQQLKVDLVNMGIMAAEKILKSELDKNKQKQLVEGLFDHLEVK